MGRIAPRPRSRRPRRRNARHCTAPDARGDGRRRSPAGVGRDLPARGARARRRITGVPGSGKSTLVAKLAAEFRCTGRRVGIVAIDPTSPFSGGAILGDRIRMGELAPTPACSSAAWPPGVAGRARARHARRRDVLDAAGYEIVLMETVGVGQDEVDRTGWRTRPRGRPRPGLGDDIQAIKAGILEIADIFAVNKSDRPDADRTVTDLKAMLAMGQASRTGGDWHVPVLPTCALSGAGIVAAPRRDRRAPRRARRERHHGRAPRRISTNAGCCWPAPTSCATPSRGNAADAWRNCSRSSTRAGSARAVPRCGCWSNFGWRRNHE